MSMYAAFGRSPAPLSTYDLFGARWEGFIHTTTSGMYTFRTVIGGDDERVKLWIDNKMIIDHWTSLNYLNPKVSSSNVTRQLRFRLDALRIANN